MAAYDPLTQTIFLPERWTGNTPAEISVLVHEMVHHLQNVARLKYECVQASEELASKGAQAVATPADVAAAADVISVMVLDDEQVRDVLLGESGIAGTAKPGTVVAIHSTIRAGTAEQLSEQVAGRDISIVDAPVSGGFMGAHAGTLAVLVGGPDAAVERCREPFGRWAKLFVHFGPTGAGTRAKLARNLLHFVAAAGLDLAKLAEVVRYSDGITGGPAAIMFRNSVEQLELTDPLYEVLAHVRTLGEKDLSLALELGETLGVALPLARLALERFAAGLGVPHEA